MMKLHPLESAKNAEIEIIPEENSSGISSRDLALVDKKKGNWSFFNASELFGEHLFIPCLGGV